MSRRRLQVGVIGFVVLVAGCSGSSSKPSATNSSNGWVRMDLAPVSQPYRAGGRFVLYVAGGSGLQVVGLDAATGRTVWKADASASGVTQGVAPTFAIDGDRVVFLRDAGNGSAELVGVSGRDGSTAWSGAPGVFSDWASSCVDDLAAVCTTGFALREPTQARELRFSVATGEPLPSPVFPAGSTPRSLAPALYDLGTRKPEKFAAVNAGTISWQRPLASVFTMPGVSTDNGWNFDRAPKVGLFVGSVTAAPTSSTPTSAVFDLSKTMTTGFRIGDGSAVWRDLGTEYACSLLPCPGMARRSDGATVYRPPTQGLRLRLTGIVRASKGHAPTFSNLKVIVEGFALESGRTLWSDDAGAARNLLEGASLPELADNIVVFSGTDRKPTALNLQDGSRMPVASDATAWCQTDTTYTTNVPDGDSPTTSYQGSNAVFPCKPDGRAVATPKRVPRFAGPLLDGLIAWSQVHKVVARPPAA